MQEEKSYSLHNREFPTPWNMDAVRKLILDRSADLDRPLSDLSRAIGKNHAYLQQFIRREIPKTLDEDTRAKLAMELKVAENDLKLRSTEDGVNHAIPKAVTKRPSVVQTAEQVIPASQLIGERDLPVFAAAQGGSGVMIVSNDPVEWVARPEPLAKVRDGYGVIVLEDSMSPEFEPGDIALVHPHLPPTTGLSCVFKAHRADGSIEACIKRLRRITADAWHVREFNGPDGQRRDFILKRSEWQECHVTVGRYSRR